MNWVFLDFIHWDYDAATPLERPLGGSQSALCYLATTLARRGEQVTTLTGTTSPRVVQGVRCLRHEEIPAEVFAPDDTLIVVLNGPADAVQAIRSVLPREKPIVLWTQHAHDQPAMAPLRDPACVAQWDRIICISDWQRQMFHEQLQVPLEKMEVLRNAIGPQFVNRFRSESELSDAKSQSLRLAYTSTPFRGLEVLLACYPAIQRRHMSSRLDVFSSMQVYCQDVAADPYQALYERCQTTAGVNYRGSVTQQELARELLATSILAYPNTFAETSCIAVMEALAAGLLVITSDLGALPETCAGWARLVPPAGNSRTREQFAIDYARALDQALTQLAADRAGFMRQRFEQVQAINAISNWEKRATEWETAAQRWMVGR